jgi:hypothetical protein
MMMMMISGLIFESKVKAINMPENVIIYAEYRFNNFLIYRAFHNVLRDYIYNKKTKGPTLMELQSHRKTE